ncbi:MAG: hypothetical protein WKG01_05020 [Kofleriaceae bacterium]
MHAIHFHGSYRYDSREALDRALAAARLFLDEDDVPDPALTSLRSFVRTETSVTVDIVLPPAADARFAAAAVFHELAREAIGGAIEARQNGQRIDLFVSGEDD